MSLVTDWDEYALRNSDDPATPFSWTPYAGYGPTLTDILGILDPEDTVLELGCGAGARLAHIAGTGARAIGVDLSGVHVAAARARCGQTVEVHEAEAVAWLDAATEQYDIVVSVFGTHWFTDPALLLPAIRRRLHADGSVLLARTRPTTHYNPVITGHQTSTRHVLCWDGEAHQWADALADAGFDRCSARTVAAPVPGGWDTVILRAWS
ncbi:class I SAM-dependent methyltransferase [Streptomyces bambusae]|uniref:Methyltransferase domain-containing protein n=1 Tax=Streptomyces bambusae TaxID=1550616 RepID=A0ABS6ZB36_9ACTN|nr:class I SAM-dependent methyltransferase [Streptomyces bambusae]MBW5484937.1 methyltransferase domain-containing protein [Streptomyces bambusae]